MTDEPAAAHDLDTFSEPGRGAPAIEAIGAARLPLNEPGVQIWRVPLEAGQNEPDALAELLSTDERGRADTIRSDAHRRRFVIAHAAVRLLLAHHLRQPPRELVFALGSHGKPHLAGTPGLEFNLTHSGELALIALSRRGAVGVDVESLARRPLDLQPMARRVLTTPEREWLEGLAQDARAAAFLQLWACKEAVSKAAGGGFTTGFAGIHTEPRRLALAQPQEVQAAGGRWQLHVLAPGEGYVGALALAAPPAPAG